MARSTENYLCYDLGGTKLAAALVTAQGRVLHHGAKQIDQSLGLKGLLEDFRALGAPHARQYKCVSVASAGPLHAEKGVLLDPTNFFTGKKSWGVIPLVAHLKRIFKKPVFLENDAAAAVLAERWKGGHGRSRSENIMAITLGTGVGVGAIINGQLARAGRGLHPEVSHIPINVEDKAFPCGCGAFGCVEAYLAGSHFVRHLSLKMGRDLDGEQCRLLARQGEAHAVAAFAEYGKNLALALRSFAVMFAPEIVVLAGGFARSHPYFLPATERHLPEMMSRYREGVDLLPKIRISKLGDQAGVIGAAYLATQKMKKGR